MPPKTPVSFDLLRECPSTLSSSSLSPSPRSAAVSLRCSSSSLYTALSSTISQRLIPTSADSHGWSRSSSSASSRLSVPTSQVTSGVAPLSSLSTSSSSSCPPYPGSIGFYTPERYVPPTTCSPSAAPLPPPIVSRYCRGSRITRDPLPLGCKSMVNWVDAPLSSSSSSGETREKERKSDTEDHETVEVVSVLGSRIVTFRLSDISDAYRWYQVTSPRTGLVEGWLSIRTILEKALPCYPNGRLRVRDGLTRPTDCYGLSAAPHELLISLPLSVYRLPEANGSFNNYTGLMKAQHAMSLAVPGTKPKRIIYRPDSGDSIDLIEMQEALRKRFDTFVYFQPFVRRRKDPSSDDIPRALQSFVFLQTLPDVRLDYISRFLFRQVLYSTNISHSIRLAMYNSAQDRKEYRYGFYHRFERMLYRIRLMTCLVNRWESLLPVPMANVDRDMIMFHNRYVSDGWMDATYGAWNSTFCAVECFSAHAASVSTVLSDVYVRGGKIYVPTRVAHFAHLLVHSDQFYLHAARESEHPRNERPPMELRGSERHVAAVVALFTWAAESLSQQAVVRGTEMRLTWDEAVASMPACIHTMHIRGHSPHVDRLMHRIYMFHCGITPQKLIKEQEHVYRTHYEEKKGMSSSAAGNEWKAIQRSIWFDHEKGKWKDINVSCVKLMNDGKCPHMKGKSPQAYSLAVAACAMAAGAPTLRFMGPFDRLKRVTRPPEVPMKAPPRYTPVHTTTTISSSS